MDDEEITQTFPSYKTISFMWPIFTKMFIHLTYYTLALLSTGYNHFGVDIFVHDSKGKMFLLLLLRDFNAWEAHYWLVMCPF